VKNICLTAILPQRLTTTTIKHFLTKTGAFQEAGMMAYISCMYDTYTEYNNVVRYGNTVLSRHPFAGSGLAARAAVVFASDPE
jgi:hypothetical protein